MIDCLLGDDRSGLRRDLSACIGVTVEPGVIATGNLQAYLVPLAKNHARGPEINVNLCGLLVMVRSPKDAFGDIVSGAVRMDIH